MAQKVIHINTNISDVQIKGDERVLYKPYIDIFHSISDYHFPFSFGIKMIITGEPQFDFDFAFKFTIEMLLSINEKITLNEMYGVHLSVIATAQDFVNKDERLSGCTVPKPEITDILERVRAFEGLYDFVIE